MCYAVSFNVSLSVGLLLTLSEGVCMCLIQCPSVCWTATVCVCVYYAVLFSVPLSVGLRVHVCVSFNVPLSVGLLLTSSEGVCMCLIQCPSVCWTATDIVRGCMCVMLFHSMSLCLLDFY